MKDDKLQIYGKGVTMLHDIMKYYVEKARVELTKSMNLNKPVSDRILSKEIGLNESAVNQWKKRNILPSDEIMLTIASLGNENPAKALMELNALRSTGDTKKFYENLANFFGAEMHTEVKNLLTPKTECAEALTA